jgi:2-polyprenyl-6-hydroxyphenyl methylase/3-demethylubiquinone-9 3-methyltransferase
LDEKSQQENRRYAADSESRTEAKDIDHRADDRFVDYYRDKAESDDDTCRSEAMFETIGAVLSSRDLPVNGLSVADIGCGPGGQSIFWASRGFDVHGLDVSADFIDSATSRADTMGLDIDFRLGTAARLPWPDESMDICLAPELLEHVPEWQDCLDEFARILRPGGLLYINTSNTLCPVQNEFELPLYSWYPGPLKRHFERLAVTTRPDLANYATYPAVNWFTYYGLRREFRARGFESYGRLDLVHMKSKPGLRRSTIGLARASGLPGFAVQLLTPYTLIIGVKSRNDPIA